MTFYIPAAPTKPVREACCCSQDAPSWLADEPNWEELRKHGWDNCPACKGEGSLVYEDTAGPSINVANQNGYALLAAVGLPCECSGAITPQEAPAILRRALHAANTDRAEQMAREPLIEGRVISCGTTADRVRFRFHGLVEVLKYAVEHNQEVVWG